MAGNHFLKIQIDGLLDTGFNNSINTFKMNTNNQTSTVTTMTTQTKTQFVVPSPISMERISWLINEKGIMPEIAGINLEMIKMKVQHPEEGNNWTPEFADEMEVEYKRFLHLNKKYPKAGIVPTDDIDEMWHFHILDTRAYVKDSETVFGGYFHHFPYFGLRGEQDEQNLKNAFEETKELYFSEFSENMLRNKEAKCWHSCQSRCWHACSSKDHSA